MKHAYLIIAHHEFEILQALVSALDVDSNDIYIHFDKKVKRIPELVAGKARLYILGNRIDVRWGHVSQIVCEYALFEASFNNEQYYTRYHLISGTHIPLKKQIDIMRFFQESPDIEFLNFLETSEYEKDLKLRRYHFFLKHFRSSNLVLQRCVQLLWRGILKIQFIFNVRCAKIDVGFKASNWVSLTEKAVAYILTEKMNILERFEYSFCGDEFFIPYLLEKQKDTFVVEGDKHLLFNEFEGATPRTITSDDYNFLIESKYLFARKFSRDHIDVVHKILNQIKE